MRIPKLNNAKHVPPTVWPVMKNWTQAVYLATLDSKSLNQHATFLVPSPPTLLIQLIAPLVMQHVSHAQVHYLQIVFLVLIQPTSILPPRPVSLLASTVISPILKKEYVKVKKKKKNTYHI
jgi:hypothetical protein